MEEPNEGDGQRPRHKYITETYAGTGANKVLVGFKVRIRGYEWLQIPVSHGFNAAAEIVDR